MLMHVIDKIAAAGITDIVVNVHHHADMVIDYINHLNRPELNIAISDESERLLDTGGGIARCASQLVGHGGVLVHNADILTDFPLCEMIEMHRTNSPDATLLAWPRKSSRGLLFDNDGIMRGWINHSTSQLRPANIDASQLHALAFGGVHILSDKTVMELAAYKNASEPFSITDFYIDTCSAATYRAFTPREPFNWFDIGRPDTLQQAREFIG